MADVQRVGARYWESNPPSPGIFINYRYVDIMAAVALDELLIPRFGEGAIFRADRSLRKGELYKEALFEAVACASILLVIIGSNWSQSLIEGKHDWVLLELSEAKEYRVPILPVFMTRIHNEHTAEMKWSPVERCLEQITKDTLPPGVPCDLLDGERVTFGTATPKEDAWRLTEAIGRLAPMLS